MPRVLGANQKVAIARIASQADRLIAAGNKLLSAKGAAAKLCSKRFGCNGQPVDHMKDLDCEKVWPRLRVSIYLLRECLADELKQALDQPRDYLLPESEFCDRRRGSRVRASEKEWFRIVKAGYDRVAVANGLDFRRDPHPGGYQAHRLYHSQGPSPGVLKG